MSYLSRLLDLLKRPVQFLRNPAATHMKKVRGQKGKPRIKGGRFSRQVIRAQQRARGKYTPGRIGPSDVSEAIAEKYGGNIMSRRQRKRMAKALCRPFTKFYNGPVSRRKG